MRSPARVALLLQVMNIHMHMVLLPPPLEAMQVNVHLERTVHRGCHLTASSLRPPPSLRHLHVHRRLALEACVRLAASRAAMHASGGGTASPSSHRTALATQRGVLKGGAASKHLLHLAVGREDSVWLQVHVECGIGTWSRLYGGSTHQWPRAAGSLKAVHQGAANM